VNRVEEIKIVIHKNKKRLTKDLQESKELVRLLGKATYQNLSKEEKSKVKEQLLNICRGIPAFTVFMLPGGVILLPLLIKYIPTLLPSAHRESNNTMHTYIALLRGINVSGHKKIKMEDLKRILSYSDFKNIKTYIQSGNIIFNSSEDNQEISQQVSDYIYKEYKFQVPVIVKNLQEWSIITENNPFIKDPTFAMKSLYITFLSDFPTVENIEILKSYKFDSEKYFIDGTIIYSVYPNGAGKTKMTNNFFENKLKVSATSRNWNTVHELFSIASNN
jgi:uncharacterized protein (DUF1697 family)